MQRQSHDVTSGLQDSEQHKLLACASSMEAQQQVAIVHLCAGVQLPMGAALQGLMYLLEDKQVHAQALRGRRHVQTGLIMWPRALQWDCSMAALRSNKG